MTTAALRYRDLINPTPASTGDVHALEKGQAPKYSDDHGAANPTPSIVRHHGCRNEPSITEVVGSA